MNKPKNLIQSTVIATGTQVPRTALALVTNQSTTPAIVSSDVIPFVPPTNNEADRHGVGFVDEAGKARALHHADLLRFSGHPVHETKWPIGYTVDSTGVANAKRFRAEVDAMPAAADACDRLVQLVALEDRRDLIGRSRATRMLSDGSLSTTEEFKEAIKGEDGQPSWKVYPAGMIIRPEEASLVDLATDIKAALPPGSPMPDQLSRTLISSPPMLREQIYNFWQSFQPAEHGIVLKQPDKLTGELVPVTATDKVRKLRTRTINGERTMYASVGEDFPPLDVDFVAKIVKYACSQVDGDLRARADYDGRNVRITVISHSTVDPRLYVAGEVFRASAVIGTDDTGGGAIYGWGAIERNLCRNLIILQTSKAGSFKIEHRGRNMRDLILTLAANVANAFKSVKVFSEIWNTACDDALTLPDGTTSAPKLAAKAAEVFALNAAAIVTKRDRSGKHVLSMRGSSDENRVKNLVPSLIKMWSRELGEPSSAIASHNGLTRAALVNSLTRYAHEVETDAFRGSDLEREAGDLLTAKAHKLPTVDQWADWGTSGEELVQISGIV